MIGDEYQDPSSGVVFILAPTVAGDDKGDWDFIDTPLAPFFRRDQRRTQLDLTSKDRSVALGGWP